MKPVQKITALTIITIAIIVFWLAPNINKATDQRYTRLYEDTDKPHRNDSLKSTKAVRKPASKSENKTAEVYKRESINTDDKFVKLKARMFSRAIHFEPEITTDSAQEATTIMHDTTNLAF